MRWTKQKLKLLKYQILVQLSAKRPTNGESMKKKCQYVFIFIALFIANISSSFCDDITLVNIQCSSDFLSITPDCKLDKPYQIIVKYKYNGNDIDSNCGKYGSFIASKDYTITGAIKIKNKKGISVGLQKKDKRIGITGLILTHEIDRSNYNKYSVFKSQQVYFIKMKIFFPHFLKSPKVFSMLKDRTLKEAQLYIQNIKINWELTDDDSCEPPMKKSGSFILNVNKEVSLKLQYKKNN